MVKMGSSSPNRGENTKIDELPPPSYVYSLFFWISGLWSIHEMTKLMYNWLVYDRYTCLRKTYITQPTFKWSSAFLGVPSLKRIASAWDQVMRKGFDHFHLGEEWFPFHFGVKQFIPFRNNMCFVVCWRVLVWCCDDINPGPLPSRYVYYFQVAHV